MCLPACRIFYDSDSFPVGSVVRQTRLWAVLDCVLAVAYAYHSYSYDHDGAPNVSFLVVSVCLSVLFAIDGLSIVYLTNPKIFPTVTPGAWFANSALNIVTIVFNWVYFIQAWLEGQIVYTVLGIAVLVFKTARALVIHKIARRLAADYENKVSLYKAMTDESPAFDKPVMGIDDV